MDEKILITVDIAANDKTLKALLVTLADAKVAQAALVKANAEGRLSNDDLALATNRYKTQAAAMTGEIKLLNNMNQQQIAANKAAAGSVDELKAKSALLTTQVNALGEAGRKTAAGQELVNSLKNTNDALIAAGKNVSDGRRSVGLYTEALKEAGVGTGQLTGGLKNAASQGLAPFQGQLDRGSGLLGKFKNGSDLVRSGLKALQPAGETANLGLKAVSIGLASIGIGVILLGLQALISYFVSTNEGSKILKQGLAALGAVVTSLTNVVYGVGKGLVQVFTEPEKAAQAFLQFLKDQVVNRLLAFGVLIDGIRNRDFKKITDSVIQFSAGITNGTDKAAAYANSLGNVASRAGEIEAQLQKLKKSRAEMEVDEVKEKGRVDVLIKLSKDRTLSAGERLNKLREAGRIEEELSAKSLKQTTAELALLQERNKAKGLSITSDEIQEERDKRKEYNATVAERDVTLSGIKARQSRFILEERAELLKDQKERSTAAQKLREDAVKEKQTEVERQLLAVAKGSAEELVLLQKKLDLAAALTLASEKKTAAERALILSVAEVEKKKLQDDFDAKAADAAAKAAEAKFKEQETQLEDHLAKLRAQLENDFNEGKLTQKQYNAAVEKQDDAGFSARIALAKLFGKNVGKLEEEQAKAHGAYLKNQTAEEKKAYAEKAKVAQQFGAEIGALFLDTLNDTGASLEDFAAKVLVLILDNLEKTVLAAQAEAVAKSIGSNPTPAGFIQAAVSAALITVAFEGTKALLSKPAKKQFAVGGLIEGPSHAAGGVPFSVGSRVGFEAEGGEILINKNSSRLFAPLLSHLNQLGGGVAFAAGGLVPGSPSRAVPVADGGLVARQLGSAGPLIDYTALARALSSVNLAVSVEALQRAETRYNKPRAASQLGG